MRTCDFCKENNSNGGVLKTLCLGDGYSYFGHILNGRTLGDICIPCAKKVFHMKPLKFWEEDNE